MPCLYSHESFLWLRSPFISSVCSHRRRLVALADAGHQLRPRTRLGDQWRYVARICPPFAPHDACSARLLPHFGAAVVGCLVSWCALLRVRARAHTQMTPMTPSAWRPPFSSLPDMIGPAWWRTLPTCLPSTAATSVQLRCAPLGLRFIPPLPAPGHSRWWAACDSPLCGNPMPHAICPKPCGTGAVSLCPCPASNARVGCSLNPIKTSFTPAA